MPDCVTLSSILGMPEYTELLEGIHKTIQIIFNSGMAFDFKTMYMTYPPEIKGTYRYLMGVLLTSGKKALTKRWLTQAGPTIKNWTDMRTEIRGSYKMERVTFSVNLTLDIFIQHWEKWVQ